MKVNGRLYADEVGPGGINFGFVIWITSAWCAGCVECVFFLRLRVCCILQAGSCMVLTDHSFVRIFSVL